MAFFFYSLDLIINIQSVSLVRRTEEISMEQALALNEYSHILIRWKLG